jgi:methylated-DNA-[protein]-cysteine S-methyltransferase
MMSLLSRCVFSSPVGALSLVASEEALVALLFGDDLSAWPEFARAQAKTSRVLTETMRQLEQYFQGSRREFDLPLNARGTEFQVKVWSELRSIPFGKTWSYKDLANRIGNPKAVRAVGGANGRNPISIIVPCHRVIGARGDLVGFGGGLSTKTWLLKFEQQRH